MDKLVVVHIYSAILLTHKKKEFESVKVRWMILEPVIQSEVSQKGKNKYHILTHIYRIYNGTDESLCRAGVEMQSRLDGVGEGDCGTN